MRNTNPTEAQVKVLPPPSPIDPIEVRMAWLKTLLR